MPSETATPTETPTLTPTFTPSPTATALPSGPITIDYTYDPLNRLTAADYSSGDFYHYSYDAVGNRLLQETSMNGLPSTANYVYDDANRLMNVDGVDYTWDANGNLLSDRINTYTYDSANRLTAFSNPQSAISYAYNGLGDRLQETVNGETTTFTMDLNAGLTQALSDGTNTYLYGLERIAQSNTETEYFLGDALGSVRQMTDGNGAITYARAYDPYGVVTQTTGAAQSAYGYTGEWTDASGMLYLRARYYAPNDGRFLSRDTWAGDVNSPMSFNRWGYANANPIVYTDPGGRCPLCIFLIALAIGTPLISSVTTSAWDYSVIQGGGLGGRNWNNPECIDWSEVANAGGAGLVGALEPILAIPLGPDYLFAALYGKSPKDANTVLLGYVGLQGNYAAIQNNPYYRAGQYGGQTGTVAISLYSLFGGLPSISASSNMQLGGYNTLALSAYKVTVVGGDLGLVSVGSSGLISSSVMMSADGGGGGGRQINLAEWEAKKPFEGVVQQEDGTTIEYEVRQLPGADGGWSRIVRIRDANGNTVKVIHEAWSGTSDPTFDPPDHVDIKFVR